MDIVPFTLILLALGIGVVLGLDRVFHRLDTGFYVSFRTREKAMLWLTAFSIAYLLYVLSFGYMYVPLAILGVGISIGWLIIFFLDTSLEIITTKDKILLLSITLVSLISIYFGFRYLILLGMTTPLKTHLTDSLRKSDEMFLADVFIVPDEHFHYSVRLYYVNPDINHEAFHNTLRTAHDMLKNHLDSMSQSYTKIDCTGGFNRSSKPFRSHEVLFFEYYFNVSDMPLCQQGWYSLPECDNIASSIAYTKIGEPYHICDECKRRIERGYKDYIPDKVTADV